MSREKYQEKQTSEYLFTEAERDPCVRSNRATALAKWLPSPQNPRGKEEQPPGEDCRKEKRPVDASLYWSMNWAAEDLNL